MLTARHECRKEAMCASGPYEKCSCPQPVEQEGVAHLWDVGPDTLNERIVGLSSVSPAHGFEDSCAARLCRHVQDLTDIAMRCNDLR